MTRLFHGRSMNGFVSALGLIAAACAAPPEPPPTLGAGFDARAGEIRVAARDRLPLVAATLRLPDGRQIAAREIAVSGPPPAPERPRRAGVGVGAAGGSSSGVDTAVVIDLPLSFEFFRRRSPPSDLIDSRARIVIDDQAAYRRVWAAARLHLRLGDPPGETREVELPAPAPDG